MGFYDMACSHCVGRAEGWKETGWYRREANIRYLPCTMKGHTLLLDPPSVHCPPLPQSQI